MNDNAKSVLALLAGLAAGAAIGLLLAPEKGSDTRHKLADALNDIGNDLKEKLAAGIDSAKESVNKTQKRGEHLADKATHAASEIVE